MSDANALFTGSIPDFYDRHLGPVIFEPYADDLARRVAASAPAGAVLEIACGTGIVTRELRARLAAASPLVATDLNQAMLDHARARVAGAITWQQADACALLFDNAAFSAAVCQFGLMFVPDRALAFAEARRVLKPGGLFAFNVWDSIERNPFARIAHATIASFFASDPPAFYAVPFSFHDRDAIEMLLKTTRFDHISIDALALPNLSTSAASFAVGLVKGNPVCAELEKRGARLDTVIDAVATALRAEGGDEPFRSNMRALVVTARADGS